LDSKYFIEVLTILDEIVPDCPFEPGAEIVMIVLELIEASMFK